MRLRTKTLRASRPISAQPLVPSLPAKHVSKQRERSQPLLPVSGLTTGTALFNEVHLALIHDGAQIFGLLGGGRRRRAVAVVVGEGTMGQQ